MKLPTVDLFGTTEIAISYALRQGSKTAAHGPNLNHSLFV